MGRRVGSRDAGGFARVDGRVSHSALPDALRARPHQHVRVRRVARHRSLYRAGELAGVPRDAPRSDVAAGRDHGARRTRDAAASRGRAVCRHEKRAFGPVGVRSCATDRRGGRHQVRPYLEHHGRRDHQPRLRPGRGRPLGPQPRSVRDVLPGAAAVLPRGHGHLPVRRELQRRELRRRRAVLLPARGQRVPHPRCRSRPRTMQGRARCRTSARAKAASA